MISFTPGALTQVPQTATDFLIENGAPAALISVFDGVRMARHAAG